MLIAFGAPDCRVSSGTDNHVCACSKGRPSELCQNLETRYKPGDGSFFVLADVSGQAASSAIDAGIRISAEVAR